MREPEVAVVYSPRDWLERLDRFVFDHGGVRIRAKVVDRRDATEERYDVLVVDDFTAFVSRRFVDELHRQERTVLGVYDPDEAGGEEPLSGGRERLRQCGVDDFIEASAEPSEFVAAIAALAAAKTLRLEDELALAGEAGPTPPEPSSTNRGLVTVVGSPCGGCGATEVTVALTASLRQRGETAVAVDADDVAPSLAQRLGLALFPNLRTAIQVVEDGEAEVMAFLQLLPGARFEVVAGLTRPKDWAAVRPFEVAEVVRTLATARQQTVVNVGHRLEDLTWLGQPERYGLSRHMVGLADSVVGVSTPTPVGVTRLLEWVVDVSTLAPGTPVHLVFNRAPRGSFRRGEVENEVRRTFEPASLTFIPADERVEAAHWAGEPVSRGLFAKAVDGLAQVAVPRVAPAQRDRHPVGARE